MYYPSKDEFIQRSRSGNLVPVYRDVLADMETPVSAYRKIARGKYSFLPGSAWRATPSWGPTRS